MTMLTVDVERAERVGLADAKANLSALVARVEESRDPCVLMRYNRPAALLVPLPDVPPRTTRARGSLAAFASDERRCDEAGAFARAVTAKHGHDA